MNSRYHVAVCNLHENENKILEVSASSPQEALIKALSEGTGQSYEDTKEWLMPSSTATVEDMMEEAFAGDTIVSRPIVIH